MLLYIIKASVWFLAVAGLCHVQFISAVTLFLSAGMMNAAGLCGSGCSQIKIVFPRTHAHLPFFHEFAWLEPSELLTRHEEEQDTGHSLVSILAYLKADLVSNTKR